LSILDFARMLIVMDLSIREVRGVCMKHDRDIVRHAVPDFLAHVFHYGRWRPRSKLVFGLIHTMSQISTLFIGFGFCRAGWGPSRSSMDAVRCKSL
jgi:hypothetical protein